MTFNIKRRKEEKKYIVTTMDPFSRAKNPIERRIRVWATSEKEAENKIISRGGYQEFPENIVILNVVLEES